MRYGTDLGDRGSDLVPQRITYLSPSQRKFVRYRTTRSGHSLSGTIGLNYLVTIDSDGKLRWARNGQLVDTTAGRWKDAGGGKGIVPFDDPTPGASTTANRHSFTPSSSSSPASSTSSLSGDDENAVMHYVGLQKQSKNPVKRVLQKNFTIRGLLDRLLRKTIKRNTWIYVSVSLVGSSANHNH